MTYETVSAEREGLRLFIAAISCSCLCSFNCVAINLQKYKISGLID